MDFKSEYKNLQENISPSAEFLEQLEYKMNVEKEAQRLKKNKLKRALIFVPILTTVCASAAALTIFVNLPRSNPRPEPVDPAPVNAADVKFPYATGVFENKDSLSDGDELPRELSEMLSQSSTALYKSGTNTFDYDDLVGDGERAALSEKIKAARKTDGETTAEGCDYYMMTLENGDIFKFRISEDILEFGNNFYKLP